DVPGPAGDRMVGPAPRPAGRILRRPGPVFPPGASPVGWRLPRSADHGGHRTEPSFTLARNASLPGRPGDRLGTSLRPPGLVARSADELGVTPALPAGWVGRLSRALRALLPGGVAKAASFGDRPARQPRALRVARRQKAGCRYRSRRSHNLSQSLPRHHRRIRHPSRDFLTGGSQILFVSSWARDDG